MVRLGRLVTVVFVFAIANAAAAATAHGQTVYPATVTGVTDGDTLAARLVDGRELTVRLIGIDAPEPTECGGSDARAALATLASGQAVELESDPSVPQLDGFGRSWFYVDRADGLDVGFELVRRGWATVVSDPQFARLRGYLDAEQESFGGVWAECDGDFHLTRAEQRRELGGSAKEFVRRYYRRLSNDQFRAAWRMLGGPVKRKLGYGYRTWRTSHRGSIGVSARAGRARVSGGRVVVSVRLRSRDRDVCNGRAVAQRFAGSVVVASRDDNLAVVKFRIRKTGGGIPRLSKSRCPPPSPPPETGSGGGPDCQGYDPCLTPGSDVDCAGGSGNGPRYIEGPVYVGGDDPYDLDGDGDGVACEI